MTTKHKPATPLPCPPHHASCTPEDVSLIHLCEQCGHTESAPDMVLRSESVSMSAWIETDRRRLKAERERARLVEALRECRATINVLESVWPSATGYTGKARELLALLRELGEL